MSERGVESQSGAVASQVDATVAARTLSPSAVAALLEPRPTSRAVQQWCRKLAKYPEACPHSKTDKGWFLLNLGEVLAWSERMGLGYVKAGSATEDKAAGRKSTEATSRGKASARADDQGAGGDGEDLFADLEMGDAGLRAAFATLTPAQRREQLRATCYAMERKLGVGDQSTAQAQQLAQAIGKLRQEIRQEEEHERARELQAGELIKRDKAKSMMIQLAAFFRQQCETWYHVMPETVRLAVLDAGIDASDQETYTRVLGQAVRAAVSKALQETAEKLEATLDELGEERKAA